MSTTPHANSFVYSALRPGGGRKIGVRQAASVPALAQSLRSENQLLLKTWRLPGWMGKPQTLNLNDQADLNEQLSQLLSRGVPLVEALDVVAQTVRPASKGIVMRMKEQVASGMSFADTCKLAGCFDNVTVAVYRGAERSGDLAGAGKELSKAVRRTLAIKNKTITVLMYPAITMAIAFVLANLLLLYVVPMIAEGLRSLDMPMPWFSRVVMDTSLWMRDHVVLLAMGFGALLILAVVARAALLKGINAMLRKAPVMREMVIAQESARFFSVMAALTRTGVPIADALGVANQVIGHPGMRSQLERLRTRLIEGGMLRLLIDEVTTLPIATRRLLVAAERSGDMESAFGTLATDTAEQVDRTSSRVVALIEPLAIVLLFLVIGSMIMAIMLPMLTMTSRMKL